MVDGILNLDKPKQWTSHDVVAHVRRLTGVGKVGHAGTLDPMATGVLLVCLGKATRIIEYLMRGRKRYRAVVRLGITTDSHDADGRILDEKPVTVSRGEIEAALDAFRGHSEQIPPMVSAIKKDGEPLYKLARRGLRVEREPRPIEIHELTLVRWSPPDVSLEISCSPGTYIRALARDLGNRLGCGAHLTALVRLASGRFTLDAAIQLDQFTSAIKAGQKRGCSPTDQAGEPAWHRLVLPMDAGLQQLPACELDAQESRLVRTGRALPADAISVSQTELCRAYAELDGRRLLALLRFDANAQVWRPHKVFLPL